MADLARGRPAPAVLKGGGEWYSAFTAELQDAVDAVKSGKEPSIISGSLARDALKMCLAEARSITTGKSVNVA